MAVADNVSDDIKRAAALHMIDNFQYDLETEKEANYLDFKNGNVTGEGTWDEALLQIGAGQIDNTEMFNLDKVLQGGIAGRGTSSAVMDNIDAGHGKGTSTILTNVAPLTSMSRYYGVPNAHYQAHLHDVMSVSFFSSALKRRAIFDYMYTEAANTVWTIAAGNTWDTIQTKNWFIRNRADVYGINGANPDQEGYDAWTNAGNILFVAQYKNGSYAGDYANGWPRFVLARGNGSQDKHAGHGTSFAAPRVGGLAALIKSVNPNFTATEIVDIICETARTDFDNYDEERWGHGVVDAELAIQEALRRTYFPDNENNTGTRIIMNVIPTVHDIVNAKIRV